MGAAAEPKGGESRLRRALAYDLSVNPLCGTSTQSAQAATPRGHAGGHAGGHTFRSTCVRHVQVAVGEGGVLCVDEAADVLGAHACERGVSTL
eukprot:COSAG01_NODE_14458_length_1451_cov_2.085059_2_plen_92_part_01